MAERGVHMPKHIDIGSLWQKKEGGVFIITRERGEELFALHGFLLYCQEVGTPYGLWASPEFIIRSMTPVSANFSPTA